MAASAAPNAAVSSSSAGEVNDRAPVIQTPAIHRSARTRKSSAITTAVAAAYAGAVRARVRRSISGPTHATSVSARMPSTAAAVRRFQRSR